MWTLATKSWACKKSVVFWCGETFSEGLMLEAAFLFFMRCNASKERSSPMNPKKTPQISQNQRMRKPATHAETTLFLAHLRKRIRNPLWPLFFICSPFLFQNTRNQQTFLFCNGKMVNFSSRISLFSLYLCFFAVFNEFFWTFSLFFVDLGLTLFGGEARNKGNFWQRTRFLWNKS